MEINDFEVLLNEARISSTFFDFIKNDRDCYYSSLIASIALSRLYELFPNDINAFPEGLLNMWKGVFMEYPLTSEQYVKTRWWLEYAENYIRFNEFTKKDFSANSLMALYNENKIHTHNLNEARKFLSGDLLEFYSAYYLFINAFQKRNEKELITLFDKFNSDFPNNIYSPFIKPFIEPVREFYGRIENEKNQDLNILNDYLQINSLNECLEKFRGKPVFIDVWATWCSPCLAEFREREKLHNLLEKYGYDLLYISIDNDENDTKWKSLISDYNLYKGYHVRANTILSNDLTRLFDNDSSVTIPWYMIIDRKGNIMVKHAAKPSNLGTLELQLINN